MSKHVPLQEQVAIVTGASSGIGRATAEALSAAGARVVLAARNQEALQSVAALLPVSRTLVVPTDVTDPAQVQALIDRTMAQWGRIDILVANAGQYVRGAIVDLTADDMARSLQVNFYGAYHAVMAALPAMRAQHSGHVVLLSSMDARKGMPTDAPYVVAKAALTGFGDVLRQELRAEGIEVSTIMPGRVDTPLIASMRVPAISAKLPPERVARAVIAAIRHHRAVVILPAQVALLDLVQTVSPRMADWFVRRFHLQGWDQPDGGRDAATTPHL
jgi:NADP-dependent 3-hydroxy acid dehydrogenase YdfG